MKSAEFSSPCSKIRDIVLLERSTSGHNQLMEILCKMVRPSRRRQRSPNALSIVSMMMIALIFDLQCGAISAFTQPRTQQSHPIVMSSSISRRTTTATALSMVAKSGGRLILTDEQFHKEVLENDDDVEPESAIPILVLFSAPWCGPCRLTNPVVKEIMTQYESKLDVIEISTDDLPGVAEKAGVRSIPTIQLYHGGKVLDTIVGCVAKNVLARAVDKVLEDLGMLEES